MKQVILILTLLLLVNCVQGQVYEIPLRQRIFASSHIFEGKVLKSESFWNQEHTMIYTSHLVKVNTLFKGVLGADEVCVITKGGWVGEDGYDVTHHLKLNVGDNGVFFCEYTKRYPTLLGETHESFQVYSEQQGFLRYYSDGLNAPILGVFDRYFHPEKDLFRVIEQQVGVPRVKLNPTESELKLLAWMKNKGFTANSATPFGVVYSLDNPHITGIFGQYLEFDIKVSTTNNTYTYGGGELYIDYNASVFGNDVVANGLIQVNKDVVILSADYTLNSSDATSTKLKIEVNSIGTNNLYDIDYLPENLCHITFDISNIIAGTPQIAFDETAMQGLSDYFNTANNTFSVFPYVVANDSINSAWASMFVANIDSISPDTVPAGTGTNLSVLSIHGSGFGGFSQKGCVLFQSADDTLPHWVYANKGDILSWSNTLIKVKVPSADSLGLTSAATGKVIVETSFLLRDTSDEVLQVPYAVKNGGFIFNNSLSKIPYRFIKMNPTGGLTFYFNQNFPQNAREVFTAALGEWRCKTGLNYTISTDSTVLDTVNVSIPDTIGVVSFDKLPAGINAVTQTKEKNCIVGVFPKFYIEHSDMIFQDTILKDWYISLSTGGITNTERDFYSTCVHELGHAHLLEHAQWKDKVMFLVGYPGANGINRSISNSDKRGGLFVMSISKTIIACSNGTNLDSVTTYVCAINAVNNPLDIKELRFYPNPSNGTIMIDCAEIEIQSIQIIDALGREVYVEKNTHRNSAISISLLAIPNGVYSIICTSHNQKYVGKLSIQE